MLDNDGLADICRVRSLLGGVANEVGAVDVRVRFFCLVFSASLLDDDGVCGVSGIELKIELFIV